MQKVKLVDPQPVETTPPGPEETGPQTSPLPRLLCLAGYLILMHYWMQRHLDYALWTELGGVVGVSILAFFLNKVPGFLDAPIAVHQTKGALKRVWTTLLDWRFLAILGFVLLVLGSSLASVAIHGTGVQDERDVSLFPDANPNSKREGSLREDAVTRFLCWTGPFGRTIRAEVEGYQSYSFELYPWIGKSIRPGADLTPSPTVLIRVPAELMQSLPRSKVKLERILEGGETENLGTANLASGHGSVQIGRPIAIPPELLPQWIMEAEALGLSDGTSRSKVVLAWRKPAFLDLESLQPPGAKIKASFYSAPDATEPAASLVFTVSSRLFQDVVLDAN